MRDCFFIISKTLAEKMISEDLMPNEGAFYIGEYLGFISKKAYLTPSTYKKFSTKFTGKPSMTWLQSVFEDGGKEIGANASYGHEHKDITFLAAFLDITNPSDRDVIVFLTKEEADAFSKLNLREIAQAILNITGGDSFRFEFLHDDEFLSEVKKRDREFASHVDSAFSGEI